MTEEELKKYSTFNEEELPFRERVLLQKMCKSNIEIVVKVFNRAPSHLRTFEKVYFAKYLNKDYSFYINEDKVYVAPKDSTEEVLKEYFVPENCEIKNADDFYDQSGIGYRNLRVYDVIPGLKYKLIKHKALTGYPSFDRPWALQSEKYVIKEKNLLKHFSANRSELLACKDAIRCYDQILNWKDFEKMVDDYTKSLAASNVNEGDVIPIFTQSIIESVALFFAADSIGASTLFIDPDDTSIDNINKYIKRFNSKIAFTSTKYADNLKQACVDTNVLNIVVISPKDSMPKDKELSNYTKEYLEKNDVEVVYDDKIISFNEFVEKGKNYNDEIKYCENNDHVALITSTSGTSGDPKLVNLTRSNIMHEMSYIKRTTHIDIGPKGLNMQVVSFNYPYGFVISTLLSLFVGKTAGLSPDITPENYIKFLEMYKPTYIHAIPSFYKNMLNDKRLENMDLSFLQFAVSGGDFYDYNSIVESNEFFAKHNSKAKIKNGFGSAEATACVTAATVGKYNAESVGKPLIGANVKIIDKNGNEVPYGHLGNICYSGKSVMLGYDNNIEETNKVKIQDSDGIDWIVSDAIGFVDNEGFVYVSDREKNLFTTYGENGGAFKVYPNGVRLVINSVEGVEDSLVVKKSDSRRDLVPYAFIKVKEGYDENDVLNNVRDTCKKQLNKSAVPIGYNIIPNFIIKESGKVNYNFYEELAETIQTDFENVDSNTKELGDKNL